MLLLQDAHKGPFLHRDFFPSRLSSWCACLTEENAMEVLLHLPANHEEELCGVQTNTCARMTILKDNIVLCK